jgi:hypothetical protein
MARSRGPSESGAPRREPDFADVLEAAARLQALVPDAVLVGGSAAAHHVGHRVSFDDDHVVSDLRDRFAQVLETLEGDPGWTTRRVQPPRQILGRLDGIETGIRQLRRSRPLEVEEVDVAGHRIAVPTLAEMTRIKAWLVVDRNATRDYLDFVALAGRLGVDVAAGVGATLDDYYEELVAEAGPRTIATQLARQLAQPQPFDLDELDLREYRQLDPRWQDWDAVRAACLDVAVRILDRFAAGEERA